MASKHARKQEARPPRILKKKEKKKREEEENEEEEEESSVSIQTILVLCWRKQGGQLWNKRLI